MLAGIKTENSTGAFIENVQILQKIILALGIFDWKNLSLFKKIRFENLEPGKYLVKIYKENPRFGKEKKYIDYMSLYKFENQWKIVNKIYYQFPEKGK